MDGGGRGQEDRVGCCFREVDGLRQQGIGGGGRIPSNPQSQYSLEMCSTTTDGADMVSNIVFDSGRD